MAGKVVPFELSGFRLNQDLIGSAWNKVIDFVQPQLIGVELCLEQAAVRSPEIIRDISLDLICAGERLCPALFLTITNQYAKDSENKTKLAASLHALDLALRVHRSIKYHSSNRRISYHTPAILAGDFFFSLALNLAETTPIFIKGMAEIISRVVSSEIGPIYCPGDFTVWRKSYIQRLSDGYASILSLSASLAGWYNGMEARQCKLWAYFGHYLGMGLRLRQEKSFFKLNPKEILSAGEATLPLIYVLEHSKLGSELLLQISSPEGLSMRDERFINEYKKTDPDAYVDRLIGNCLTKACEVLEELQGSLPDATAAALNNFFHLHELAQV